MNERKPASSSTTRIGSRDPTGGFRIRVLNWGAGVEPGDTNRTDGLLLGRANTRPRDQSKTLVPRSSARGTPEALIEGAPGLRGCGEWETRETTNEEDATVG